MWPAHICGPARAGPRGLISWLRSSLQIIADKIAPSNISENKFPLLESRTPDI